MDNTVIPYQVQTDSDDESNSSGSSDSSEEGNLLTNNIGVLYNGGNVKDERFMNQEKVEDYQDHRNKIFTPKISKIRILIDSKNIDHSLNHNTSNYTIHFQDDNTTNQTSGFSSYSNVIGFKFIKAIIPNSIHQINDNNNIFFIQINGSSAATVTLDKGRYTFEDLGAHLQTKLSAISSYFTVTSNTTTYKYTITHVGTTFKILWNDSTGYSYRLFGFLNMNTDLALTHNSDNIAQQNVHFIDLVIPEIPHIACKKNTVGKNVIERIPLGASGSVIEYTNDLNLDNYFYPINLSKLSIQLYEDTTNLFYECQNADNSFEFEMSILNY